MLQLTCSFSLRNHVPVGRLLSPEPLEILDVGPFTRRSRQIAFLYSWHKEDEQLSRRNYLKCVGPLPTEQAHIGTFTD